MTDGIFQQYGNSYRLKKNIRKTNHWPYLSFETCTNSFGFRDKKAGERNINDKSYSIFMGSSDTFANGVNYEDSFVGIFDEAASKKDIEVLNMAVGGQNINEQKAIFMDFINNVSRKPSTIYMCINPLVIYLFDKKPGNIMVKDGYLFDKNSWKVAYVRLILGNLSTAYCFFRDNIRRIQAKWININSKDNQFYLQMFLKNSHMHHPETIKQFEEHIDKFEQYCLENRITLIFIYLPWIDSFKLNELLNNLGENPGEYDASYYEEIIKNYCENRKLKLISTTKILKYYYDKGEQLTHRFEPHYNKYGNRIIGEYLIEEMFEKKN